MNATRVVALSAFFWGSAIAVAVFRARPEVHLLFVALASVMSIWVITLHVCERIKRELLAELRDGDVRHIR